MSNVVEIKVETTRSSVELIAVDNSQLVRVIVSLIKSLSIEKEVLKVLRGY